MYIYIIINQYIYIYYQPKVLMQIDTLLPEQSSDWPLLHQDSEPSSYSCP